MNTLTLPRRISDKIEKVEDGCWLWAGALSRGYGQTRWEGKVVYVHRLLFEMYVGPIEAETLDHLCRQPSCVNPAHLEPVSGKENTLRGVGMGAKNARKVRCKRGHTLAGDNLYVYPAGNRECRTCKRILNRRWRQS